MKATIGTIAPALFVILSSLAPLFAQAPAQQQQPGFSQTGVDFDAPVDTQHPSVLKGQLPKTVTGGGTTTLDWDLTLAAGPAK
jgi:hypothetical protein